MDDLDPARVIVVESIAALENAIEALMPAQAPGSSRDEFRQGADHMRATAQRLIQRAQAIEAILERLNQDDS